MEDGVMRIDETDTSELAQRLRVGPRELLETVGGPWYVTSRDDGAERERPGTLFVGRAGPSVAVLVGTEESPEVEVGVAVGRWTDPGTLVWDVGTPGVGLTAPGPNAPSTEIDAFLAELGVVIDDASAAKARHLVTCRYCGILVAPELAFGEDSCQGCGTTVLGVVY
jgi:hypothetical protein